MDGSYFKTLKTQEGAYFVNIIKIVTIFTKTIFKGACRVKAII